MNYTEYLQRLRKSKSTIEYYSKYVERLRKWCTSKQTTIEALNYKQLVKYIATLKDNHKPETINIHLIANFVIL